jgi:hypothetical protein
VAVFENGAAAVAVSIPPGRDLAVLLKVTAPAGAVVGETAELMVTADVGAPHNKHDSSTVKLPLALDGGPVLNHTLEISSPNLPADFTTPPPPAGVDGQIPKTKARTISFPVKHDTDAPDEDPGFVCSVTLDAPQPDVTALGKWVVQINGSSQLTDTTDQAKKLRTLSMPVTLTPKQPLALNVGLTVPNEDIGARLTMAVRSTKLTSTLEKSSQPLVIRTR